jgi:hypothetical protein
MKNLLFLAITFYIIVSCSRGDKSNNISIGYNGSDSLKKSIELKENNLKNYYQALMQDKIAVDSLPNQLINELIKSYQIFYQSYPKDTVSPFYIDKIHQLFTQEKQYSYAVDWVDTLLSRYPNYRNKTMVLYSAAISTDMYLLDSNRVKRYYIRMIDECPKLKIEVKKQIQHRLKYLKIPYVEYLSKKHSLK